MKQRLWGAAVLIALAVVFLPMLVKGPAPDSGVSDVPLDSPKAPDATVKTQELPLDVPGAVGQGGATGMPAPQPQTAATPTPASATPAPQSDATTAADAKPSPATAAGDYAVNFGSYGSSSDADRVVQALAGIKLRGYSEKVSLGGRDAWRVRVGPYPTREAAEVARVQSGQLNAPVKAQVIALDATPSAPAPAAASASTPVATAAPPPSAAKPAEAPAVAKATENKPGPADASKAEKAPVATKPAKPVAEPRPTVAKQDAPQAPTQDAPEPQPAAKPAAAGTGFAVQLGAFANAAEATALRDRARAAGFSATTDTVHTDKGVLTRVRLGPVVGRDAANALKARAQTTLGVSGIVRASP